MKTPETEAPQVLDAVIFSGSGRNLPVAGLANLDRLVLTALAAGVRRIAILGLDPEGDRKLLRRSSLTRGEIQFLKPGTGEDRKFLQSVELAGNPFFLLHTELALEPKYLQKLAGLAWAEEPTLIVGRERAGSHPFAFGVRVAGEWIAASDGTSTTPWLGAGILPASAAASLEGGQDLAGPALQGKVLAWAEQGRARVAPVLTGFAGLIASEADLRTADGALLRSTSKESDGFISRHLNRRVSQFLSLHLVRTRVTPNLLTFGTLLLGLLTGAVLLRGEVWSFIVGTFLYHLNSTIDGCDGEIARIKFLGSRFGEWADTLCDQVGNITFAVALPFGLYRYYGNRELYYWLGILVAVGIAATLVVVYFKTRKLTKDGHFNDYGRSLVRQYPARSLKARALAVATQMMRRDFYALLFFVLALARAEVSILYLLAAGVVLHLLSFLLPSAKPNPAQSS